MDLRLISAEMVLDGLDAEFLDATEELPSDRINVLLLVDGFDDEIVLQVTEVETDPEDMPGVEMFQLWAAIPVELDEAAVERVTRFLPAVNTLTPLIGFSVLPEEGIAYFRHVGMVSAGPESIPAIVQSVWMAHFALDHLAGNILRVAISPTLS